jgi:choloylglycine hydrolase
MKRINAVVLSAVVLALISPGSIHPCTTFCFQHQGDWIFGRNYDWNMEHALVVVNKRGLVKRAAVNGSPVEWISRYGSISFNQYGCEFPLGGMNEKGLVIECMWLEQTVYPQPDTRPEITELQWIQFHLDTSASVDEVIAKDQIVRISIDTSAPLHFLLCDKDGGAAVIEFLNGRMKAYTKKDLAFSALANSTYADSLELMNACNGDEDSSTFADSNYSLKRFVWAAKAAAGWPARSSASPVDYALDVLEKVSVDGTMFRIVYDVKAGRIHYRTKSNPAIRFVDALDFDYSCRTPLQILDMAVGSGNITDDFSDYSFEANYRLLKKSYAGTSFLQNIPDQAIRENARYPESVRCKKDGAAAL